MTRYLLSLTETSIVFHLRLSVLKNVVEDVCHLEMKESSIIESVIFLENKLSLYTLQIHPTLYVIKRCGGVMIGVHLIMV